MTSSLPLEADLDESEREGQILYRIYDVVRSLTNKNSVGDDGITTAELKKYWKQCNGNGDVRV
mgnify:CR=1 FL=1